MSLSASPGELLAVLIALIGAVILGIGLGSVFSDMLDRKLFAVGIGIVLIAFGIILVVIAILLYIVLSRL